MGTLSDAWTRLKTALNTASKNGVEEGAKADPKKNAAAIQTFINQFGTVMTQFDGIYKKKKEVDASFKEASDKGLKLIEPFLKQVDAAHKDGFNPNDSAQGNMDDRLSEVIGLLKELKQYGSQTQWD